MRRLLIGVSLISLVTLMTELVLTRAFEAILTSNIAYMIITCALFSFGLSGIYSVLKPIPPGRDINGYLSRYAMILALCTFLILPIMNFLPFDYTKIDDDPLVQLPSFAAMYLALVVPFFFSGLIFANLFSLYAENIKRLYSWDLAGAAIGCLIVVPFIPAIGPGGLLFCASALALFASALFSDRRTWAFCTGTAGVILLIVPFAHAPDYFDFKDHVDKRNVKRAHEEGRVELTRWDPISKIDIIDMTRVDPVTKQVIPNSVKKHIAYDGGEQTSYFYPFDGNLQRLRESWTDDVRRHFWDRSVVASHYLKRDTGHEVLVIGSAGGQETKAALMYGAAYIDAVELVGTVVNLGLDRYAAYTGNIFTRENVNARRGEGRSFLRSTDKKYDVIQNFSNHTSSSAAAGSGAMMPVFLQTAEAYQEYFEHLKPDGILQVNHPIYPRMITTAALAWRRMGRDDFRKHVVVYRREGHLLTLLLVKMSPWEEDEIRDLNALLVDGMKDGEKPFELVEDPIHPERGFLSDEFFSGRFSTELARRVPFRAGPTTDGKPYFKFIRKGFGTVEANPETYLDRSTAAFMNASVKKSIPMDVMHLIVTGASCLLFAGVFVLLPLFFSKVGREDWPGKLGSMTYFSCLGAGFIIFEIMFIHIFQKLIGYPLYTYSTVLFTLLLGAGVGSFCSERLKITSDSRWPLPFLGVLIYGLLFWLGYSYLFDLSLSLPTSIRILVGGVMIFPLGFFLGMPFPLGILALEKTSRGAIAWAWGMNGLFTQIGGLFSVLFSIYYGFNASLMVALFLYVCAFAVFSRIRKAGQMTSQAPARMRMSSDHQTSPPTTIRIPVGSCGSGKGFGDPGSPE